MNIHAIQRAKERYGVTLTDDDLRDISAQVTSGTAIMSGRSHAGKIYLIRLPNGKPAKVIVSEKNRVITFLSLEMGSAGARYRNGLGRHRVGAVTGRGKYKRQRFVFGDEE